MNISAHITYFEATYSDTAINNNITNMPNSAKLVAMQLVATKVFEPLRAGLGNKPIRVTSFFRSKQLNKAIGGSKTSQHMKGEAIDMQVEEIDVKGEEIDMQIESNKAIFDYIRENLEFDQVISEFPDENGNPTWVHVSYSKTRNRKEVLRSVEENGKTVYKVCEG